MSRTKAKPIALLIALSLATVLLAACGSGSGSGSGSEETLNTSEIDISGSGAKPNAWRHVNAPLRKDILAFGKVGTAAELERATRVVRGYLVARANGDAPRACTYLSQYMLNVVEQMAGEKGKKGCVKGVEDLAKLSSAEEEDNAGAIEPEKIRRKGKRAFVFYTDSYGGVYAMLMRPESSGWKIQGFEPTRLY